MVVATRAPVLGAGFVSLLLNPAHRIFTPAHVHVAEIDSIDLPQPKGGRLACGKRGWSGVTTIDLEALKREREAASG